MTDGPSPSVSAWQEATIEKITVATPTVKSFVLRPTRAHPFLPGQHIDVRLTAPDGYAAHRSYSISSAPDTPDTLELTIEALRDGEVSSYFHEIARIGDTVDIRGPFATHFVWRPALNGAVLLVGGGSGVAGLMSMVRHRAQLVSAPPMTLLYSARSWVDVIFRDELLQHGLLQHELQQSGLRVLFCLTRDSSGGPAGRSANFTRRIDAAIVADVLAALPVRPQSCFVCGSNPFVGAVADALLDTGILAADIRTERFGE